MAKGQKHSGREPKKPKQETPKPAPATPQTTTATPPRFGQPPSPVNPIKK
jgi:hypothetical protein